MAQLRGLVGDLRCAPRVRGDHGGEPVEQPGPFERFWSVGQRLRVVRGSRSQVSVHPREVAAGLTHHRVNGTIVDVNGEPYGLVNVVPSGRQVAESQAGNPS